MSSHELAKVLLESPDLPIMILPLKKWTDSMYLDKVIHGQSFFSVDKSREPGPIIILQIKGQDD